MTKKFIASKATDARTEILRIVRSGYDKKRLRNDLRHYHDKDIADIIGELTPKERGRLFESLGSEALSEIVPYLDNVGEYLSSLIAREAADIIEKMDTDDAAEALDSLDEEKKSELLELIEDNSVKEELALLDSYGDDLFGSRMSTDFIAFGRGISVKEAMKLLISEAAEKDNIYTLFFLNPDNSFYGALSLKELISARDGDNLENIVCTTFPYVYDNDNISENIERLRGYFEDLIPVLSSKDNSILGVITSSDITDMVDEELVDDYAKLAALSEEEERDESVFQSMKKRVPWLTVLLFLGLTVSSVVGLFEGIVNELPLIVAFQSLILGMAGNVGTQSLAVTVRVLGSEQGEKRKQYFATIIRETRVALINGGIIGGVSFLTVGAYLLLSGSCTLAFALSVSGCVGAAMCISMMISGFTGASIPICLHVLGADPAIASGPLITTVNDLAAVISYYGFAWALLLRLA